MLQAMGKHKKHKSDRRERYESPVDGIRSPGLKLILKVGNQNTPEHATDWASDEMFPQSLLGGEQSEYFSVHRHHKKSKKKKKKKDKNRDREHKHRHHHKEKKRSKRDLEEGVHDLSVPVSIPNVGSPSGRELRQCVLRQRQERTSLQRALDHLLKKLEMRDPKQFFAWPVTDNIAPGYSIIIMNPMDFFTMRQKLEENKYTTLTEFVEDFKLMCTNAMQYNQVDTIYYKTSKKLLHAGLKIVQPDKISWLLNLVPELTSRDLGFEISVDLCQEPRASSAASIVDEHEDTDGSIPMEIAKRRMPVSKFEAIPDDLSPEQILVQAQAAAHNAKARLTYQNSENTFGFLRQRKDGTTQLNILAGSNGVIPGTKKRPVLLGNLTGKLLEGTSQLQGFREDRRNIAKPVKPLYYGAFGSYAPSYDSAFANLTKEESDLVCQTYGSDTAVQYAESIIDFAKDCDYTLQMVDSLLDLLTGGDHTRTKKTLEDGKMLRDEEEAIKTILDTKPPDTSDPVDIDHLRSLSDCGINMDFIENMEEEIRSCEDWHELQQKLDSTSQLLERLQHSQYSRLSLPIPQHLNNVPGPTDEEIGLADSVTDNLADIAKRVHPGDIVSVQGIHKALGVVLPPEMEVGSGDVPDLESELRQFLECEQSLPQSPLRDDKTIEEILME